MRYFLFSIIINFIWLPLTQATTNCTTQIDIPEPECKTLLSLFNSTTGAGWYDIFEGGWNITNTPCSWAGIICREGHVIAIDRQKKGLNGSIPDLTNLGNLEQLDLSYNQLNGSIVPANFPPSLQTLSLNNNQLSGIAPDLNHFSHLKTVNLGNNQLTATIDDNDASIISPSFISSVPLCPTNKPSINNTCNASGNTLLCGVTIEEGKTVAQAVFECDTENKGWISHSTIEAGATVQGGILTGSISNDGILADFEFRGSSLIGGILSGIIINNSKVGGYFQDVSLAPNTQISGGRLKGKIMGDVDAPALIEGAEILEGSQLSYVTIGENTQVAKGVKIGAGVRFTHQNQIPTSTDLTAALVVNFSDKSKPTIDMNTDVLINAPTLLEQINELPEIKDNNWQLVQNPKNGQLNLTIEGIRFAVLPVQVKQTNRHAKLTIKPDERVIFTTTQGREIMAYPMIQDMPALIEAVAPLGIHQVILQENGILTAELDEGKVVARTDMAATPVSDDEPLGLFPSELNAMRLIFEDDTGQKYQQRIYPTCAYPKILDDYSLTWDHQGKTSITIKGKRYQGIFDYMLSPNENGEPDTQVVFTPVPENGNIVAFEVIYPTGEKQMLRLIRVET